MSRSQWRLGRCVDHVVRPCSWWSSTRAPSPPPPACYSAASTAEPR